MTTRISVSRNTQALCKTLSQAENTPPQAAPKLSIIVPLLNEAGALPGILPELRQLADQGAELILVDGGSTDASCTLIKRAGLNLVHSQRGRAQQMNAGAQASHGQLLLFLHADTRLPKHALLRVTEALADENRLWGRFDVLIDGRPVMLRVIAHAMNLRSRLSGIATGDQAMFMRRSAFDAVGGFPAQPLMEDIEMSSRLKRLGAPACLRHKVTTSGRRWERHGVWKTIVLMWRLRLAYWLGSRPETLWRLYRATD